MAGLRNSVKRNSPGNTQTTQHACSPSLAHESKGDRSLISDAKSQELPAAAGTTSAPASTWEEAIKHPHRAQNAKLLQLGAGGGGVGGIALWSKEQLTALATGWPLSAGHWLHC